MSRRRSRSGSDGEDRPQERERQETTRRQVLVGLIGIAGCADSGTEPSPPATGSGGSTGGVAPSTPPTITGGRDSSSGGSIASGGSRPVTGGSPAATGGSPALSGGAPAAAGGSSPTGGRTSQGGKSDPGTGGQSSMRKQATDRVVLGSTGIEISRLAMGSGTNGSDGASDQTRLGLNEFASLLVNSYDRGITFWETADAYGSHAHLKQAMAEVGRKNITVLTKTRSTTRSGAQADIERFLKELGTDYIDVVLVHERHDADWTTECEGAMEYLEQAKSQGLIRSHGVSCHTIEALRLAAQTPWVEVDLARINPQGVQMDAAPETVIEILRGMKADGKGVIGMKIFGAGRLVNELDRCIQHAVELDCIDGFTIGFKSSAELDEVTEKIAAS